MHSTLSRIAGAAVFGITLLATQAASASLNILGTYTGSFSGTEFNCRNTPLGPIVQPGPFPDSFTFTLVIDDQQLSNFTGTGTTDDGDVVSISGQVFDNGDVSASFTSSNSGGGTSSGSFIGTLSGNTLSVQVIGSDDSGPPLLCEFDYTGTLTRITTSLTNPELTSPTNIVTPTELRSFTRFFGQSLSQRFNVFRSGVSGGASAVSNGFMLQANGMNAGESMLPYPFGVWGSFSKTDSDDDSAARLFKSDRSQFLGGVDLSPMDGVIVGVAVGYETSDVTTPVNGGAQEIDGVTAAPYIAVLLTDNVTADMSIGFSNIDIDQSRVLAATTLNSEVDSTRTFITGNVAASHAFGDLLLTGRVGFLYARDRHDAFTETGGALTVANSARTFKLGQVLFGGEASYLMGEFEPFASFTWEHDYTSTSSAGGTNDDNGGVLGVGLRYFGSRNGISGSIDYQTIVGRKDLDEGTFGVNFRVDF